MEDISFWQDIPFWLYLIYFFSLNAATLITYFLFFINLFRKKITVKEILIAGFIMSVGGMLLEILFDNMQDVPLLLIYFISQMFTLSCLMIFAYIKTTNILLSGFYATLTVTMHILLNSISNTVLLINHNSMELPISPSFLSSLLIRIPTGIFCFICGRFLGKYLELCYAVLPQKSKRKLTLHGLLMTGFVCFSLQFVFLGFVPFWVNSIVSVLIMISLLYFAIVMTAANILSQHHEAEALFKAQAEKDLAEHMRQLQLAYSNMRGFRHDYRNLLFTLMSCDNMVELKERLSDSLNFAEATLKDLDGIEARLNMVNISELRSLLWIKCAQAQSLGIDVRLNIAEPIYDISLNREDLCRLVGIVTDNAIEELAEHDEKSLKLSIVSDEGDIIIDCANPCRTQPLLKKIFDEGYSTKGPGRGLGLANLKKICIENKNLSYTVRMTEGEFALVIVIRK